LNKRKERKRNEYLLYLVLIYPIGNADGL